MERQRPDKPHEDRLALYTGYKTSKGKLLHRVVLFPRETTLEDAMETRPGQLTTSTYWGYKKRPLDGIRPGAILEVYVSPDEDIMFGKGMRFVSYSAHALPLSAESATLYDHHRSQRSLKKERDQEMWKVTLDPVREVVRNMNPQKRTLFIMKVVTYLQS